MNTENPPKTNKNDIEPLSITMARFRLEQLTLDKGPITIKEIVDFFADRGIGALLFIFGAPMCIPLPLIPGVSLAFSLPLFVLAWLQITGVTRPWLPEKLASKTISRTFAAKAMDVSIPWLEKIEKFSRPRAKWMLSDFAYRWSGVVIAIMTFSIMFPLPFSNFGPGIAIVVMAVGRMMHDGLMILLGGVFGMLYVAILYYTSYAVVVASVMYILAQLGIPV